MSRAWTAGVALCLVLATAALASAEATPANDAERIVLELRLGGLQAQVGDFWPSFAFFAAIRVSPAWSVGLGYDFVRVYPGMLCSGDLCSSPIFGGSLLAGIWRTIRRETWFARGGVLLGAAGPDLQLDESTKGTGVEIGADLELGWTWRRGRFFLFWTPRFTHGTFGEAPNTEDVDALSLHYGIGGALLF